MSYPVESAQQNLTLFTKSLNPLFFIEICVVPLYSYFTYTSEEPISAGDLVKVNFARRKIEAYVVSVSKERPSTVDESVTIKNIIEKISPFPLFNESDLNFFKWVANFYQVSVAEVIDTAIPKITFPRQDNFHLEINQTVLSPSLKLSSKQREVLQFLEDEANETTYLQFIKKHPLYLNSLKSLLKKEVIKQLPLKTARKKRKIEFSNPIELNEEQQIACDKIKQALRDKLFKVFLLFGITGSGKTEVYFEAMREVILGGKNVLLIVPEIALTPQLIDRLEQNLAVDVSVLHSGVKQSLRSKAWQAVVKGESQLVLGARSAVFAPLENIGLIVVDEEHDSSYKQSDNLRYNARDLAIIKAKFYGCPVVLGSATPSLESFYNAKTGRYEILSLKSRFAKATLPTISTIDLNIVKPWEMASANITQEFQQRVLNTLQKKEQVFILYNKRGYAAYNICKKCGHVENCPHCAVSLTYHSNKNRLICHYCSYHQELANCCTSCGSTDIMLKGSGTQKIVEELYALFPSANIERMDRDSISIENSYKVVLDKVRSGEVDILVGTQMLAKGHDLPNVTLVGVVNCDVGLHIPDFRGAEKVFQLLTQVAGRAGRGDKPGKVILQTRNKSHLSIVKTIKNDYLGFFEAEIINRKEKNYPPFTKLLRIVVASSMQHLPMEILNEVLSQGKALTNDNRRKIHFLGPINAPIQKIKDLWRCHLLVKCDSYSILSMLVKSLKQKDVLPTYKANKKEVRLIFDLDPQDML
jgi:primosomal protein N' (replication factor Y) (superfamily II helicase)